MAFLRLSGLLTSITGKLNGSYFSQKKGGTTMNRCGSKLTKADSGRVAMQQAQHRLGFTARAWGLLTAEQRTYWSASAATLTWKNKAGFDYTPTGYEFYMSCNSNRAILSQTYIDEPVASTANGDINAVGMGWSVANILQLKYPPATPTAQAVLVFASAANSKGVSYPKGGYKLIYATTELTTGNTDLTNEYSTVFGWDPPYGLIFFKIVFIDKNSGIQNGSKLTKADSGFAPA